MTPPLLSPRSQRFEGEEDKAEQPCCVLFGRIRKMESGSQPTVLAFEREEDEKKGGGMTVFAFGEGCGYEKRRG